MIYGLAAAMFLVGGALTWIWMKKNLAFQSAEIQALRDKADQLDQALLDRNDFEKKALLADQALQSAKDQAEHERNLLNQNHRIELDTLLKHKSEEAAAWKEAALRHEQELETAHRKEVQTLKQNCDERIQALQKDRREDKERYEKTCQTLQEQFVESRSVMEKSWQDKLALLKEEFKNLSGKILEERTGALQTMNKEQLSAILNPLKEKMTEFKTAVEDAKNKGIEMNSAMKTQLEKMFDMTQKIGSEANNLAVALRGSSKTQGNWGEMILEKILENSGLTRGVHYEVQETIRNADGSLIRNDHEKVMRPDVIVHYPDGKDVIIDSKVSLTAYTDYVNAESSEPDRAEALTRHIRSVRSHVEELVRKNYSAYLRSQNREAVDFVIMFIPNEAPHQLVMMHDPGLWREAFEKKVLIVSPVNLMALLQMIQIAWTRADQERNQQLILDTASQMLDRVYGFYDTFDDVGKKLSDASKAYQDAVGRLKGGDGRHSVVVSGEKLRQLGVKMKKPRNLPQRLEDAELPPAAAPGSEESPKNNGSI